MKKLLLLLVALLPILLFSQSVGYLRYDSLKIEKVGGNAELVLKNKTRDSLGFLFNTGSGITQFKRIRQINDTTFVAGIDTIKIASAASGGSGLHTLNGLSGGSQSFASGTSGADFNISSIGSTHTLNIPTASASNRGLVTSAMFNAWQAKISPSDTAAMLQYYLAAGDTISLSNRITAKQDAGNYITGLTGDGFATGPVGGGIANFVLANTSVVPGDYVNPNISVDSKGRITSISNGSGGGSGIDNTNLGSFYRWLTASSQGIKTVASSNTVLWDSTSNTNALTAKVDTSVIATQSDISGFQPSGNYLTGLTGDIAATGPGSAAATISNDAVTFPKFQNLTAQRLVGRYAATDGDMQYITLGAGFTLNTSTGVLDYSGASYSFSAPLSESGGTVSIANASVSTKGAASFSPADFNDNGSGVISFDYANSQKATSGQPGILTSADWSSFNSKLGAALTNGHIFVGNGSNIATDVAASGDVVLANTGAFTLNTVNSNVGSFTYGSFTVNAKGLITSASSGTIDATPTDGSSNPVQSNGVFDALATKQGTITLTTTGSSGPATLIGNTLNIPEYAGGGGGSGAVNTGTANRLAYYPSTGTTVDDLAAITANRALISDANGLPTHATTTATEIGYVNGVTSSIQTQLNGKQATITTGSTAQYFRGDLSLATFPTTVSTFSNDAGYITASSANTLTNKTWNGVAIGLGYLAQGGATTGQVIKWNGSAWAPDTDATGGGGISDGDKGDITVSSSGATWTIDNSTINAAKLASDAVTTAKILDANVTDAKLATGINANKLADGSVSNAELQYINSLTSNAQTQIDGKLTNTLTSAQLFVGNGSNVATAVTMSGYATMDNTGGVTVRDATASEKGAASFLGGDFTVSSGAVSTKSSIKKVSGRQVIIEQAPGVSGNNWTWVRTPDNYSYTDKPHRLVIAYHGNGWTIGSGASTANASSRTQYGVDTSNGGAYMSGGGDPNYVLYSSPWIEAMLDSGYVVAGSQNFGDNLYGNDDCRRAAVEFYEYMQATYNVEAKVYMIGFSNGSMTALNAIPLLGESKVAAFVGLYPLVNLVDHYLAYEPHQEQIEAAYGISAYTDKADMLRDRKLFGHDPVNMDVIQLAAGYSNTVKSLRMPPMYLIASGGDAVVDIDVNAIPLRDVLDRSRMQVIMDDIDPGGSNGYDHGDYHHFKVDEILDFFATLNGSSGTAPAMPVPTGGGGDGFWVDLGSDVIDYNTGNAGLNQNGDGADGSRFFTVRSDGSGAPAFLLNLDGSTAGVIGAQRSDGQFFTGALANDVIVRTAASAGISLGQSGASEPFLRFNSSGALQLPQITGGSGQYLAVDADGNITAGTPSGGGGGYWTDAGSSRIDYSSGHVSVGKESGTGTRILYVNTNTSGSPLAVFQLDGSNAGVFGVGRGANDLFAGHGAGDMLLRTEAGKGIAFGQMDGSSGITLQRFDGSGNLSFPQMTGGTNYFLAIDASGNVTPALVSGGGGSLTATYVGFGDGSNALTGSSTFTWDNSGKILALSGNQPAGAGLSITDDDGGYFSITQSSGTSGVYQPIFSGYATGAASSLIFKGLRSTSATDGSSGTATVRFITRESDDATAIGSSDVAFRFDNGSSVIGSLLGDGTLTLPKYTSSSYLKTNSSGTLEAGNFTTDVRSQLSAGTGISYNSSTGVISATSTDTKVFTTTTTNNTPTQLPGSMTFGAAETGFVEVFVSASLADASGGYMQKAIIPFTANSSTSIVYHFDDREDPLPAKYTGINALTGATFTLSNDGSGDLTVIVTGLVSTNIVWTVTVKKYYTVWAS